MQEFSVRLPSTTTLTSGSMPRCGRVAKFAVAIRSGWGRSDTIVSAEPGTRRGGEPKSNVGRSPDFPDGVLSSPSPSANLAGEFESRRIPDAGDKERPVTVSSDYPAAPPGALGTAVPITGCKEGSR